MSIHSIIKLQIEIAASIYSKGVMLSQKQTALSVCMYIYLPLVLYTALKEMGILYSSEGLSATPYLLFGRECHARTQTSKLSPYNRQKANQPECARF